MYEFNLLNHIGDSVSVTDQSNVWKNSEILDIPVYTPNSITIPGGIAVYDEIDPFRYAIYNKDRDMVHLIYGLDIKGRYTFLDLAEDYTHFSYKFGGRSFPQARVEPSIRYVDDILYVTGGSINNDPMTDMWTYDFGKKTWSIMGYLPSPRWSHSLFFDDDRIYLFGGLTASRIDGRLLWINDVFWIDRDFIGEWTLLDREATLPHAGGSILGTDNNFLYLWIDKRVWSVALIGEQTSGSIDLYDIGEYVVDVRQQPDGSSHLLVKGDKEDNLGNIYEWTPPYNFTLLAEDRLCLTDDIDDVVTIVPNPTHIEVNGISFGGTKPPKKSVSMSHTKLPDGDAYYGSKILRLFKHDSLHTVEIDLSYLDKLPYKGYIAYQQYTSYIWIVGWNSFDELIVAKFDMDTSNLEIVSDTTDELLYREDPSVVLVQSDIWLMGGNTAKDGSFKDQWRFNINDETWRQEITLEPLPEQPFVAFEWRDRLWLIPHTISSLYRYYPSTRQWTIVYIAREDTDRANLGLMDKSVNWDFVDNRLFLEPKGYLKTVVELESRRALDPLYQGNLSVAIDRAHVLCDDGRLYIADGTTMNTTIADQPPFFDNSGGEEVKTDDNSGNKDDVNKDVKLLDSHPYIIHGYNSIGEWKPAYSDKVGLFWINVQDVRWYDFEERVGFYIPETDYMGDYGDTYRRLPTFEFNKRSSKPLLNAITDISLFGSRFIANYLELIRYRTEDGTYFSYKAPITEGSAVGYSSNGRVYIFGGRTDEDILALDQNGLYFSTKGEVEDDEEGGEAPIIHSQPTLVIYDLNYAQGETEYLADIPEFYERHDYDVAADYLISRISQMMPPDDEVNAAEIAKMRDNYYISVQDIIDDVSVRYMTYEEGARPSARSWPLHAQVEDRLYVGGGAFEVEPPPEGDCPPLWTYDSINENYDDPNILPPEDDPTYIDPGNLVENYMLNDFYMLDMNVDTWVQLSNTPWDHLFHASTAVTTDNKEIWVVGGYTSSNMQSLSADIYIYDVNRDSWTTFGNVPDGYLGRAKPALSWIDDDTLLIMYGTICTITTCGRCPCYWFNRLGDSWIIHRPTMTMYKYDSDLPKTFTIMPNDQDEPYIDLLYIPNAKPKPGGETDIVQTLAMSRLYSEDWTAYEEKYEYVLRNIYDQLHEHYYNKVYVDIDGVETGIDFPDFDGGKSVTYIYNQVIPDLDPRLMYDEYRLAVNNPGDFTLLKDTVVLLYYIEVYRQDFTATLISELASRADQTILGLKQYELVIRDIFISLDRITGTMYPANRITPKDLLLVRKSIPTGEYTRVQKVTQSKTVQFTLEGIKDIFKYHDGDWWLVGWFYQKGSTDPEDGFLRFYRFSPRPDGDIDLTELPVGVPVGMEPYALGYDNKYSIIALFNKYNIWRLDLDKAIYDPNGSSSYWQRLPPALNYGKHFSYGMRHLMKGENTMLFIDAYGLVLSYDLENIVWDMVRARVDTTKDDAYVVIDNAELYYIGGSTGYFDTTTYQGDRFIINSDICEFGIGTPVVPRLIVQRNLVIGFDVNNNMVSAFVRKRGTFDKSWAFPNYFYVERILVSVDYDSLEFTDEMEIYIRTDKGIIRPQTYSIKAVEPWSFNPYIRIYDNGKARTHYPDQYLAVDIYDYVAEFQVFFQPPIKDYGYVSRVNQVFVVPKRSEKLTSTNYYVACEDELVIGINNPYEDQKYLVATTDDRDLTLSWDGFEYGDKVESVVTPRTQLSLRLKALHLGKVTHLMVVNDKTKE
jgi:hypothetical protein